GGEGTEELPDLIVVDGGKGQLSVAERVLKDLGLRERVEVAALAKERPVEEKERPPGETKAVRGERVYLPNVKDPVLLKEGSRADLLLRRIRDEVHRFAITYQRKLRGKKALSSMLDTVPGIGGKRKKALFERFGDIEGILGADTEELKKVPGITDEIAAAIKSLRGTF
ncbi:MAG TPA: helix-hairpin-helix domain-containing protein, partial [Thermodesulfobacteriota bacterium]|nr:helix-hairpin-helix domain-containing protein [Thermodesulfobacteriota bacterium]